LKGSSSHEANQKFGNKVLDWQGGYGVVSFGTKDPPWVVNYVCNQRQHHATGTIVDRLERITMLEPPIDNAAAKAEPREPRRGGLQKQLWLPGNPPSTAGLCREARQRR
jgi:hypothetical protein